MPYALIFSFVFTLAFRKRLDRKEGTERTQQSDGGSCRPRASANASTLSNSMLNL